MNIVFETKTAKAAVLAVFAGKGGALAGAAAALDKKHDKALSRLVKAEDFKAAAGTSVVATGLGGYTHVVVLGLDDVAAATVQVFEKAGSHLAAVLGRCNAADVAVDFDGLSLKQTTPEQAAAQMALGLVLRGYGFNRYFTKGPKAKAPVLKKAQFVLQAAARAKKIYAAHDKVAGGVFLTRNLVSEPGNVLYPESFAAIIKREMAAVQVKTTVLDVPAMRKLGMGALLSVGQGSARPSRLVVMEYNGGKRGQRPLAFVGKGITFDTGGISIKPGAGMEEMKWDMGGAGTVTGLLKALAGRKAKVNVVGIVALAENMPSGTASRPGDVVTSMSGQTVEIINTDAEGRLVLCDALWYCQKKYKPTHVVDLATLTGAMIIALGHEYAGVFSNDDTLARDLAAAGGAVDENLWRMPLCAGYDKQIDSPIADMQNVGGRAAGSATAAHFLQRFVQDGVKWAHLDIAGMAWAYKDKTSVPKGASGFGVRLLDRYVADYWE